MEFLRKQLRPFRVARSLEKRMVSRLA
jgi:hypothetical protein